ncbi:conserved hypothetical protein [delta proteobacterium NaphS2]|nr:conserved hypothetical protein [delta proteobacterium NaphS2]
MTKNANRGKNMNIKVKIILGLTTIFILSSSFWPKHVAGDNDLYDSRYVNSTGDSLNAISSDPILTINNGGGGMGIDATTSGNIAVRGLATTAGSGINFGGYFEAYKDSGVGVNGVVNGTTGTGVYGLSLGGENSYGVYGKNTNGVGVYGTSVHKDGVVGKSETGYGVYGYTKSTNSFKAGVNGFSSTSAIGIYGKSFAGVGVYGETLSVSQHAGFFSSLKGERLAGAVLYTTAASVHGIAIHAKNDSPNSDDATAVFSNDGSGALIKGFGGDGGEHDFIVENSGRIWNEGGVSTTILEIRGGADISERFDVNKGAEKLDPLPGMVVSIDPGRPGGLMLAQQIYDRKVVGIISGAGGIETGMVLGQTGTIANGSRAVAISGRVYCLADAENGPIKPGDLLTTSNVPGHAMRVNDYSRAQGAILGKAMSPLDKGKGLVLVLVTLQ